jgi:hypothetical protein
MENMTIQRFAGMTKSQFHENAALLIMHITHPYTPVFCFLNKYWTVVERVCKGWETGNNTYGLYQYRMGNISVCIAVVILPHS